MELIRAHLDHTRLWSDFRYCYPVISRRSQGLSLGINLNPDKVCNFNCIYCEVDRLSSPICHNVDVDTLIEELEALIDIAVDGKIYSTPPFSAVAPSFRRLNDIAFSGETKEGECAASSRPHSDRGAESTKAESACGFGFFY